MDININDILNKSITMPYVKINRETFLRKTLSNSFSCDIVEQAIETNPAQAGININELKGIVKSFISFEVNKASSLSTVAGIPGGFTMAASIPADLVQYFAHILRIIQKIAYIYGMPQMEIGEVIQGDFTDSDVGKFYLMCLGVMFGCDGANAGLKLVINSFGKKLEKDIAKKALTKGTLYPLIKKILSYIGIKITKETFAKGVSKIVPVVGGIVSGGLTYVSLKPMSNLLANQMSKNSTANPNYYNNLDIRYKNEMA